MRRIYRLRPPIPLIRRGPWSGKVIVVVDDDPGVKITDDADARVVVEG